jgi:HAD superfamily hydrolase (TIGR01509 family)
MAKQKVIELSTERLIQAVALDMDGLLLNTEDLYEIAGEELMRRRGKTYRYEVRQAMMGLPAPKAYGVLIEAEGLTEDWRMLQSESDGIFEQLLPQKLEAMPGVYELLDLLDQLKLPRCVATSSRRSFAEQALSMVGVLERVDFVITAEEVANAKPHPDIYHTSAQRMGAATQRMLVLEDSAIGTAAGVAADTHIISVPNRHTAHADFRGAKAVVQRGLHSPEIHEALHRLHPNLVR